MKSFNNKKMAVKQPFFYFVFLFEQVLNPKMVYSGQKLTKLVSKKTPAKINKTMPNVPVIIFM